MSTATPHAWAPITGDARRELRDRLYGPYRQAILANVIPGLGLSRAGAVDEGRKHMRAFAIASAVFVAISFFVHTSPGVFSLTFIVLVRVAFGLLWMTKLLETAQAQVALTSARGFGEMMRWQQQWQRRREVHGCSCPRCGARREPLVPWCAICTTALATAPLSVDDPRARVLDGVSYPDDPGLGAVTRSMVRWHSAFGMRSWISAGALRTLQEVTTNGTREWQTHRLQAFVESSDPSIVWLHLRMVGVACSGERFAVDEVVRGDFAGGRLKARWDFVQHHDVSEPAPLPVPAAPLAA